MTPHDPDSWDDDRGAEIYRDVVSGGRLYRTLADRLVALVRPRVGTRLLDLATGTGTVIAPFLARGGSAAQVVGIDAAPAMLRLASREFVRAGAAFAAADPAALPFAAHSFDAVTCSAALWHMPGISRVFADVARVLGDGGRFAFNVPAAQLDDAEDVAPAPFQVALARAGRRLFGNDPAVAGPRLRRADLLASASAAGVPCAHEEVADIEVPQRELIELAAVPAIGVRLYPDRSPAELGRLFRDAAAAVDAAEVTRVRWHEFVLVRRGA